jgi:hypothetical protein
MPSIKWLQILLGLKFSWVNLGTVQKNRCSDNKMVIKIANNLVQHCVAKHIKLDRNYINNNLSVVEIPYIKRVEEWISWLI